MPQLIHPQDGDEGSTSAQFSAITAQAPGSGLWDRVGGGVGSCAGVSAPGGGGGGSAEAAAGLGVPAPAATSSPFREAIPQRALQDHLSATARGREAGSQESLPGAPCLGGT